MASSARAEVWVLEPAPGRVLRAGTSVKIRWTGVPEQTDELEILLWLGDGARDPLRLTGELDGRTRSFTWLVPNLPSARARLLVRYREEGLETEAEPGPSFLILPDLARPIEEVRRHDGELWLGGSLSPCAPSEAGLEEDCDPHVDAEGVIHPALASFRDDPVSAASTGRHEAGVRLAERPPAPVATDFSPGFLRQIFRRE